MPNTVVGSTPLSSFGEKIFYDRYALKDLNKKNIMEGDLVIVSVDPSIVQREVGTVLAVQADLVTVLLHDSDEQITLLSEYVDRILETSPADMFDRLARGAASVEEPHLVKKYEHRFREALEDWKFVPAGRIMTACGTDQGLTFFNCFVLPSPEDSREGIINTLAQMTEIMSRGGGVGINLSSLRPKHSFVEGVNGRSSGATSWGSLYSYVTGLIEQGGSRRGALMLVLECWHPDILDFITSKQKDGYIVNANISVGVTDDFMAAVRDDLLWSLVFPDTTDPLYDEHWKGDLNHWKQLGGNVSIYKTLPAREIYAAITDSAWKSAEPGVFFIDRANSTSNSSYYSRLVGVNPCGEQPLPAWGVCNLGHINLSKMVINWDDQPEADWILLEETVRTGVRFLDNMIDLTPYHFEENENQQKNERRVGLGTLGLAEMLIKLGYRYGSGECINFLDRLYEFIARVAYEESVELAKEKGAFNWCLPEEHYKLPFIHSRLNRELVGDIALHGIRNVTLLTQAPTGTVGTMIGTSTGIEPYYSKSWVRSSRLGVHEEVVSYFHEEAKDNYLVTAMDLSPVEHVAVQAAIQKWTDSSISKTVNCPATWTKEQVASIYTLLYESGCKGGTIYRDNSRSEQVLRLPSKASPVHLGDGSVRSGKTFSLNTPAGTAHITVNHNDQGEPFEVFLEVGKAGSDLKAMTEAIGRLISLYLRPDTGVSQVDKVSNIIGQLGGIGGAHSIGFGKSAVLSVPDAVSSVLARVLSQDRCLEGNDICPSCGSLSLVRREGCQSCDACGHSEC